MILSFFLILIFLNICLCWNYQYLADKLKIFDHPDNKLKIHKKKTPLLGGFFIIFNLLILITIDQSLYEIFPFEKKMIRCGRRDPAGQYTHLGKKNESHDEKEK